MASAENKRLRIDEALDLIQNGFDNKNIRLVRNINQTLESYGSHNGILQTFIKSEPNLLLPMIHSVNGDNVKATLDHYPGLQDLWLNSVGAAELKIDEFMSNNTHNKYVAFVIQSSGDKLDIYAIPQSAMNNYSIDYFLIWGHY